MADVTQILDALVNLVMIATLVRAFALYQSLRRARPAVSVRRFGYIARGNRDKLGVWDVYRPDACPTL